MSAPVRVVILGGGFAGLYTALELERLLARNIVAAGRGGRRQPFRFRTFGRLAAIGRRTGVARVFGLNFSGFIAWFLWRTVYLSKLARLEKKLRVALDWTLDLLFTKDLAQFTTARTATDSHPAEDAEEKAAAAAATRS